MLIKQRDLERIASGEIRLAFRRWRRPTVRTGGTLRTAIGVLTIDSLEVVSDSTITEADARQAGFDSLDELLTQLRKQHTGKVYRIALHLSGTDPREALRQRSDFDAGERERILERLRRFDARSSRGPWTRKVLAAIADKPGTLAAELAEEVGVDKSWFKIQVRKLKELGLTESLSTGYRLSPRGRALWQSLER